MEWQTYPRRVRGYHCGFFTMTTIINASSLVFGHSVSNFSRGDQPIFEIWPWIIIIVAVLIATLGVQGSHTFRPSVGPPTETMPG
jgi:hypothetical protein